MQEDRQPVRRQHRRHGEPLSRTEAPPGVATVASRFQTADDLEGDRNEDEVGFQSQPDPCGEWSHRQRSGLDGRFTFHAGTASAIAGTYINSITCSDPGGCFPSGNPPSPAKDVDFDGIGSFRNIINSGSGLFSGFSNQVQSGVTLHWFEVHTEDLGEAENQSLMGGNCPPAGTPGSPGDCDSRRLPMG